LSPYRTVCNVVETPLKMPGVLCDIFGAQLVTQLAMEEERQAAPVRQPSWKAFGRR
jgi:hypothetical protein